MSISTTPTYNLKVVLKETGIAADTLRAWERRYGLPIPERTPGGHRLYSQHDIEIIKWLMAKQAEGLSISRAVDLWKEETASGLDPLAESHQAKAFVAPSANLDTARQQWINACLAFNEPAAEHTLNQAFAMYPVETVCVELLQRGLNQIGEMWYTGKATVQQEHFASGLVTRRLDALISAAPLPTRPQTVLIGCPPDEWHTLSLLLMTLFLRRRGLNVIYLGANVPTERFDETLSTVRPNLIILAAQQLHTTVSLRETAQYLTDAGSTVSYGGRIFNSLPELRAHIPGHFLGESFEAAVQTIESLLTTKPETPQPEPVPERATQLLEIFNQHKPMIDARIIQTAMQYGIPVERMNTANHFMDINLSAALEMGNPALLEAEIYWIGEHLGNIRQPQTNINHYLQMYNQAAHDELGEQGKALTDWLETFIAENAEKV